MKRIVACLALLVLACGGGSDEPVVHGKSGTSLDIGSRHVVIHNGYADGRVDWLIVLDYDATDTEAIAKDDRVTFEGEEAFVTLPNGKRDALKGSNVMYLLDDEGVEKFPITLREEDLNLIHEETYHSVRELVDRLVQASGTRQRN